MSTDDGASRNKLLLGNLFLRYFGLAKVPMLLYVRPKLLAWTPERVEFRVPLNRLTKNHLGSMYFAALAAGADLAVGFLAMAAIRASGRPVSLIFKDFNAQFLKRAEGDVHFVCGEGILVADLVQRALETGEREEMTVPAHATVPAKLGAEAVATFALTLSLKLKEPPKAQDKIT